MPRMGKADLCDGRLDPCQPFVPRKFRLVFEVEPEGDIRLQGQPRQQARILKRDATRGSTDRNGSPRIATVPLLGICRPPRTRSRLDFPTPLGPRMTITSAGCRSRSRPVSTGTGPSL